MQLAISEHLLLAPRDLRNFHRVAAELLQCLADADPVGVLRVQGGGIEPSRDGSGAGQRDREAHALFVAECDDFDREGQALSPLVQSGHRLDRRDHAEAAVVLAGIAHRVDVRAENERG